MFGPCSAMMRAVLCDFIRVRVMPVLSLSCLSWWCVSVLKERAKCRASTFWGIQFIRYLVILMHLESVPLMGGPQGPSVSRSLEVSPQKKAGRPMGPSTPRCYPQSFLLSTKLHLMFRTKLIVLVFCSGLCFGEIYPQL